MNTRAFGILLVVLLIATGPVFGALTDGLVIYYSFDTNTGSTVIDQSGNGHNATVYGASYTSTGRIGGAYHYDGTNDYILAGNLGYQGKGTISFWMYADAVENWRNPFSTDYASWDDCLRFEEGGTYHDFVIGLGPIGGACYTSNMQSRTWYHVTLAWTTNKYWGWLDGKPVFTGSHTNRLYLDFPNVAIGNGYSTDPSRFWKGLVDEVRIYDRVLSDSEVSELANPSDGLILYYSFDTDTGSTVVDQSGNGHTGAVHGATYTSGGAIGGAYHFDGVDDRILGGSLGYVPTGSICFWMYADSIDNWRNPFSTDYASWDDNIHFTEAADHSFEWGALGLEPGAAVSYTQSGLQSGRWYHVVLTWDGLVTRGYLDGTLANSTPYPDPNAPVHPDISGNAGYWRQLSLTFNNIAVGNSYDTSPDRYWKGMVDEVRIYNRALAGEEIAALHDAGKPGSATNKLAKSLYYNFDTDEHGIVTDQSGNGNIGTVWGATWVPNGVRGGAYQFTGTNWIEAGDIFDMVGTTTQLTVSAWIKAQPLSAWPCIVNKYQEAVPYCGWNLYVSPDRRGFSQIIATYPQMIASDGTSTIGDDRWHFVCGTYETLPGLMRTRLYVDGLLQDTDTRVGPYDSTEASTPLTIGMREPNGDPFFGYNGLIDELRINERILSDAEILALYDADKPAAPTNGLGKSLYYNFNTNEHGIVTDQSGNGNNGTVRGATWVPNGVRGGAYQFTGTNWIEAGDIFDLAGSTTQLTVSAWIKAQSPSAWPCVAAKHQEATPYRGWGLYLNPDNLGFCQINATHPELVASDGTSIIGDEQWHFVCSTYETLPGLMRTRLYVDGLLQDTDTRAGPYGSTEASTPLTIGMRQPNGNPLFGFFGLIDELRINDRILSDAEILALYDADKPGEPAKNGLELYYSFDTNTGSTVYDQSGNGHTGLIYGPTYTASGRIGAAYQYDGVNDHILAGNLGHLGQGTISFWMYADALENWRNPFSTDYASWDDCLRFEETSLGEFVVGLGPILGGAFFTTAMQPKTWYHVAFAWTGTGYWGWLNGQLVFSGSHNNQLYLDFNNVAMGNGYSTSPGRYWKGMVDEVRIYSRVLQQEEISTLANTGTVNTMGWLTVNIEPEGARIADAQWSLASDAATNWHDSGFSLGLDAGTYTVVFKTLGGWVTPSSANVTITAGSNSVLAGYYEADEPAGPDTVPPVIVSIYPPDGCACLGNAVPMTVVVTDNVAVASVRFNHSNAVDFEPPNTYLYTRNGVRGSYNPVDIVALDTYGNITTQTINYVQSSDLLLSALWDGYWRIRNPYTNTIDCTWAVVGGVESGAVTAVANRDNFFSTSLGSKTVQLYVDGVPVGRPVDSSKVHPDQGVARALSEIDSDGDGMSNGEEELAGTDPNSGESLFSMGMDQRPSKGGGMTMTRAADRSDSPEDESYCVIFSWPSGTDSSYTLEASTDVWTWKAITGAINMPGTGGIMSYTNMVDSPQFYLRIRAQKLE